MDRKKLLTRLYELMLLLAIGFACVPFIRGCVSGMTAAPGPASLRLDAVSIGGTVQVADEAERVIFVHRERDVRFRIFALAYDPLTGSYSAGDGQVNCARVQVGYNHVVCDRGADSFSWDQHGAPSRPDMPSLSLMRYRVDDGRVYFGAGVD